MKDFFNFDIIPVRSIEKIVEKCSGNNQKGLLIIHSQDEDTADLNTFLEKILQAAGFSLPEDVLLLKLTDDEGFSLKSLLSQKEISDVLVFGFTPSFLGLNWNLPKYHPYPSANQNFLFADELDKISKDNKLKGQLWKCLQVMFLQKG